MAFLATSLSHLVICNFWGFWGCFGGKYSGLFFLYFLFNQSKIGKWTFFKSFICAFYNCATNVIFFFNMTNPKFNIFIKGEKLTKV